MTGLQPTMDNFSNQNKTLDLRTPEGEAAKQQAAANKAAALQKQAANSQMMQAQGIDGMKPKQGFNNTPGVSDGAGTPGLFTLPKDQVEHPPGTEQPAQEPQNTQQPDAVADANHQESKKGFFGKIFGK
jgi:hypothetical protein